MASWSALLSAMFMVLVSCGAPGAVTPEAQAPELALKDQATCKVKRSESKPLIVEWPSAERVALEARFKQGVVVVRYDGCDMQLLTRCSAPGKYSYVSVTPKKDQIRINSADELWASMPVGAAGLEGKLEQSGELGVDMTMVGTYQSDSAQIRSQELDGLCEGATHIVAGLTVGAFEFFAAGNSSTAASVEVLGAGAGGKSQSNRETLATDGQRMSCDKSSSRDLEPPEGCRAFLRMEVIALIEPEQAATAASKPPTGPSDAQRAAAAPSTSASPQAVLQSYIRALNNHDTLAARKMTHEDCRPCTRFYEQAGRNFKVRLDDLMTRGNRTLIALDIMSNGEVDDRVYAYLVKSGSWKVYWVDEDREHSSRFITGQAPAVPSKIEAPAAKPE